ncbi:SH3 domain-containing protein [Marinimicrobium locisalis]|uniref:SH3 domain-containing protein n=1 Tax=Marinimicrobium locisalis TaxID=546022 RepID=UPI0032219039
MKKATFIFLVAVISLGCSNESVGYKWVDVTNVDSDDTLSVRSQPDVASEKLGELRYNQAGVKVRDDALKDSKSNWLPVQSGDLVGWVNKHYVRPAKLASFSEPLKCLGTEPFWSLEAKDGEIVFSDMGETELDYATLNISQSQNHTNAWLFRFGDGASQGRMMLKQTEQCNDDMSDRLYDYEVGIELPEGRFLTGCCNPQ